MKNSITDATKELERMYKEFNSKLFDNQLDNDVRIIIQTKGRKKKVIGFHSPKRWKDGENFISEITMCAEDINQYDVSEVLIHEMVHHANFILGIKDCCTNQYHNRKFRDKALRVGLKCKQDSTYGWCWTSLDVSAQDVIEAIKVQYELFQVFRLQGTVKATYLRKFMCDCGMIIRVARVNEFSANCNNCLSDFRLAD